MATAIETLRAWIPITVVAAGLIGTGYVTLDRQDLMAQDIADHSESIDEIEDDVELIQRQLIQRQGQVELRTQRIEIEQNQQSDKIDEVLLLLQQLTRSE